MHKGSRSCPICKQNGKETTLILRQINLTEAVYICEDRNCIYPIGFQWDYVKNNILEDSDDSSDDTIKTTTDKKISNNLPSDIIPLNNSNKVINEKHNNLTFVEDKIRQTFDVSKKSCNVKKNNPLNIISDIVVKKSEHINTVLNNKNNTKISEISTRSNECGRKNTARYTNNKINKTKNTSITLPESVLQDARALSKYFSSTTQSEKPKTCIIKSVFDIIQQPVKKQNNEKKKTNNVNNKSRVLINNTSVEHNYSIENNRLDEDKNDNNFLDNALLNEQEKMTNELSATFDELFNNEDKVDVKNESLDFSEMDELLSFL